MRRIFLLFLFLAVTVISFTKSTFAQGTNQYFCRWSQAQKKCFVVNNCDPGYRPDSSCIGNEAACNANRAPKSCVKAGGGGSGNFNFSGILSNLESQVLPDFSGGDIGDVVSRALIYIFVIAGILLLLYLLLGGFRLLTSLGDTKKMQEAKSIITNALLGFIIIFIAFWLVQISGTILGLTQIQGIF